MRFNSPAAKRYRRRMLPVMGIYVVLVVVISWVLPIENLPIWPRRIAALLPVVPIAGVIWLMGRYLKEEQDEFFRYLQAQAMLLATGLLLVGATAWGFLQEYTGLPPFPVLILFPIWCGLFGLTGGWVYWRNR